MGSLAWAGLAVFSSEGPDSPFAALLQPVDEPVSVSWVGTCRREGGTWPGSFNVGGRRDTTRSGGIEDIEHDYGRNTFLTNPDPEVLLSASWNAPGACSLCETLRKFPKAPGDGTLRRVALYEATEAKRPRPMM